MAQLSIAKFDEILTLSIVMGDEDDVPVTLKIDGSGGMQVRNSDDTAYAPMSASELGLGSSGGGLFTFQPNPSQTGNLTFNLPDSDGLNNQAIITDSVGNLSFGPAEPVPQALDDLTDVNAPPPIDDGYVLTYDQANLEWIPAAPTGSGSEVMNPCRVERVLFSDADDGTPINIFTPPANAVIKSVVVRVDSPAGGGGASVAVGTSADPDLYFDENDSRLRRNRIFENMVYEDVGLSPVPIIATVVNGGQTFSGEIFVQYIDFNLISMSNPLQYVQTTYSNADDGSPIAVFTPPDNAIIRSVVVKNNVAASGGNPTIQVGTPTTPDAYFGTGDARLRRTRLFENMVYESVGVSPEPIIVTIDASGQTFSGIVFIGYMETS